MDTGHLSVSAPAGTKHKQVQDAKDMQRLITDRCNKNGTSVPPYEFLELIGKGSFGRVYKCRKRNVTPDEFVAIKILDVDALDASVDHMEKDETIKDFLKEVNTLLLLRESKAKNINPIQEAFDLHSQLWIVSEYCPGGSVHTLMKASPSPGLEEQYIIPIARELAVAMKYVHDVDIIHRDIKCGNVLISEEGQLQLCDFGIAATVQTETNEGKRTTIIGTPNWMAPEMINILGSHDEQIRYGKEVDLWAYGCTIYEMATGFPPNHTFHPSMLRKVLKTAPRLEGGTYSEELREFVAFCLQERPQDRPNADQILNHSYIANTEQEYPTKKTLDLLNRYHLWERQGGQRASLFMPTGADAPQTGDQSNDTDEWNFSTSDNFNEAFDNRMSRIGIGISTTDFADQDNRNSSGFGQFGATMAAQRGERSLQRIFDQNAESYDYNTSVEEQPLSDLPLRNLSSGRAANRETLIDLDMDFAGLEYQPTFDFNDVATIRASRALRNSIQPDVEDNEYYDAQGQDTRRATRDWKFPSIAPPQDNANRKTQDWSFAMAQTLTTAEENANRKTLDWSFTDAQSLTAPAQGNPNRRTQDWSFETAQPMEPADDDLEFTFSSPAQDEAELSFPTARNTSELAPGFRPALKHTATEPIGQFNDFLHPVAQLAVTGDEPSVRESKPIIDLDLMLGAGASFEPTFDTEDPAGIPRPSTAASIATSARSDVTGNPFFLEDEGEQQDKDRNRYSHHRQYKSEPGRISPADPDRQSFHSHAASHGSYTSHGSYADLGSYQHTTRARGSSLSSTASSLGEPDFETRDYKRQMGAHTRGQLMKGLHGAYDPGNFARFAGSNAYNDSDADALLAANGLHVPAIDEPGYSLMQQNGLHALHGFSDTDDAGTGDDIQVPRTRARAATEASSSTLSGYDSGERERALAAVPDPSETGFPTLHPPKADALIEGADSEAVFMEVDRMLADLEVGLAYAAAALHRRAREFAADEETGSEKPVQDEDAGEHGV